MVISRIPVILFARTYLGQPRHPGGLIIHRLQVCVGLVFRNTAAALLHRKKEVTEEETPIKENKMRGGGANFSDRHQHTKSPL